MSIALCLPKYIPMKWGRIMKIIPILQMTKLENNLPKVSKWQN